MQKLQMLHDFIVGVAKIPEESIQVYAVDGKNYGLTPAGVDPQVFKDVYTAEIFIENFPFLDKDPRILHGALGWWISAYEKQKNKDEPLFIFESNPPKTSSTVDLFFTSQLEESTTFENGEMTTCLEPLVSDPLEIMPETLKIYLKQEGIDAEELIYG